MSWSQLIVWPGLNTKAPCKGRRNIRRYRSYQSITLVVAVRPWGSTAYGFPGFIRVHDDFPLFSPPLLAEEENGKENQLSRENVRGAHSADQHPIESANAEHFMEVEPHCCS